MATAYKLQLVCDDHDYVVTWKQHSCNGMQKFKAIIFFKFGWEQIKFLHIWILMEKNHWWNAPQTPLSWWNLETCSLAPNDVALQGLLVYLFTKKTLSYSYRNPHYKPEMVWRPSQVYNENPYTNRMMSLVISYWIEDQFPLSWWNLCVGVGWALMRLAYHDHRKQADDGLTGYSTQRKNRPSGLIVLFLPSWLDRKNVVWVH